MDECCAECFSDSELKYKVISNQLRFGRCDRCGCESSIAHCVMLETEFLLVRDLYEEGEKGAHLAEHLQADWRIFSDSLADRRALAESILPTIAGKKFRPKTSDAGEPLDSWAILRDQLTRTNRFFPEPAPDKKLMQELTGLLVIDEASISHQFFRARIRRHERKLRLKDMGSPPAEIASPGRANPEGIPYLYLASDVDTAIAEVRPSVADTVYVAKFTATRNFKLIDLSDPGASISPFKIDADSLHRVRASMEFLNALGAELRTPTPPHRANSDYLATQYLCELIKTLGYDGVRYRSALGKGMNFAIFALDAFKPTGRVAQREVTEIEISSHKK